MRTTINDPRLVDISQDQAEISLRFISEEDLETLERYESMLGILWTRDEVHAMFGGEADSDGSKLQAIPSDRARYPLAMVIRPELFKELKSRFGIYDGEEQYDGHGMPHIPKDAESMSKLSKEQFLAKIGQRHVYSALPGEASVAEPKPFSISRRK